MVNRENEQEYISQMINIFEDFLRDHRKNVRRKMDAANKGAIITESLYRELAKKIEDLSNKWNVFEKANNESGKILTDLGDISLGAEKGTDPNIPGIGIFVRLKDGSEADIAYSEILKTETGNIIRTFTYEDAYSEEWTRSFSLDQRNLEEAFTDEE